MAVVAVLVVACSCAIALATPIAMLASIGSGARGGLMIKGGKYIELLEKSDILLIDKTGTLTLGKPTLLDIVSLNNVDERQLLWLVATVERYSNHPFARAVRQEALRQKLSLGEPKDFTSYPGFGVQAKVNESLIRIGNFRWLEIDESEIEGKAVNQGKSLLFVETDGEIEGYISFSDRLRSTVPEALATIKKMGFNHIELLTGDNELVAADLAARLEIEYRANLLPEDKIQIVKSYQREGHRVVMIGDGINDAPALAQADVGIAMSSSGTDVALELAHVVLMRDDWNLVPKLFQISRRTMRVVRMNLMFTAFYNGIGLTLAALGILPPVLAAAAQSLPDLGILANSSRLMRD
jgi:Cd2+/Zn2+-exporting ATPase/Cu+-exporting ATPase